MSQLPLDPIWEEAARQAASQFAYGDVIDHAWLESALDIKPPAMGTSEMFRKHSLRVLARVESFKETMLVDHQRYLQTVRGVGYRVVPPQQQTQVAMNHLRNDVRRSLVKAQNALENINTRLLSQQEAQDNIDARAKVAWLGTVGRKQLV